MFLFIFLVTTINVVFINWEVLDLEGDSFKPWF